jgi:type I restriction enzyme S subunit
MNAEQLLQHFERISEAPDAIPRLRRFILDLAVRGKLLEQDSSDEPAEELLKRIAVEKAQLMKSGKIKREKPLPPLTESDKAFEVPSGWEWVRLGDLTMLVTSGSRDWAKHYSNDGAIFVRMGNLSKDHYRLRLDHIQRVKAPTDGEGTRTRLEPGDILISITGEVGMLGLIPDGFGEAYINQHTAMVRPVAATKGVYLAELFRSQFAQAQFNGPQRGIKNSFRLTDVTQFVVPLPPLTEQHRIVAKVDELMSLCDQLEAAKAEREQCRDSLVAASLQGLNQPADEEKTFREQASFIFNILQRITTRAAHIKQLRQTILNLAVCGKLVPQDPNDEPAVDLLKKIDKAPKREMRTKSAQNGDCAVPLETKPLFDLPKGWEWSPFRRLALQAYVGIDRGRALQGPDKAYSYLRMNNIRNEGGIDLSGMARVDATQAEVEQFRLANGDFLFNTRNSIELVGKTCVFHSPSDAPVLYNNNILRVRFIKGFSSDFLDYWFRSDNGSAELEKLKSNTTNVCAIYQGKLATFPCVIPPLAEQHRIVAKVDELMSLCDQLEAQITATEQDSRRFLESVLAEALSLGGNLSAEAQVV